MYWMSVERRLEREEHELIMIWVKMKAELKKKYLSLTFRDLLDKLSNLKRGNMNMKQYMNKFKELVVQNVISMKIVVLPFLGFALD